MDKFISFETELEMETLLLGCDESILKFAFPDGFKVSLIRFDEFQYKENIVDGSGTPLLPYDNRYTGRTNDTYILLTKEQKYQIDLKIVPYKPISLPDRTIQEITDKRAGETVDSLNRLLNLLRVYKKGNIGIKDVFIRQVNHPFGIKNTLNFRSINENRNSTDLRLFSLNDYEMADCSVFISEYISITYSIMKDIIENFAFALDQIGMDSKYTRLITVLESLLIKKSERDKKEPLAKRVAAFLESDPNKILALYSNMKTFYKNRSISIHEGDRTNIIDQDTNDLEEITRRVIKKYMEIAKRQLLLTPDIQMDEIKRQTIANIKTVVQSNQGIFHTTN